jgi:hypothetical protein
MAIMGCVESFNTDPSQDRKDAYQHADYRGDNMVEMTVYRTALDKDTRSFLLGH